MHFHLQNSQFNESQNQSFFTSEYDGYDDVYGHSVDDDYYISPSNRQFIYNRETSRDSRFEHADDIQEVDEVDELTDIQKAKLNSCMHEIQNVLGTVTISKPNLVGLILKYQFNVELVVNAILEDPRFETNDETMKNRGELEITTQRNELTGHRLCFSRRPTYATGDG